MAILEFCDGSLTARGRTILSGVPDAVVADAYRGDGPTDGVYLGAVLPEGASRLVLSLGTLRDLRFLASHMYNVSWMRHYMGSQGWEIPLHTKLLLVESAARDEETLYVVFLLLVDGAFHASLEGAPNDVLDLCLERGESDMDTAIFFNAVFVGAAATDPFTAISGAVQTVNRMIRSFGLCIEKGLPQNINYLGCRCTSGDTGINSAYIQICPRDNNCVAETLGAGLGGRVDLARMYQELDQWVCVSHHSALLYSSKQKVLVKASDNYLHPSHIPFAAYNSLLLGEFMLPDWNVFSSVNPLAEYHASARAISGGPIYLSDEMGNHNFSLLRKLVLPNGSLLRARLPGRPTMDCSDCLFTDPTCDGRSLLKIWSMNKYTGVIGIYNCQRAPRVA